MATTQTETLDMIRERLMAAELRIRLMAKMIGPSHHSGSCEDLSDEERVAIEEILTSASDEIDDLTGELERVGWALKPASEETGIPAIKES